MSSDTLKKLGAVGRVDAPQMRPGDLTVIGHDISAAALKHAFGDNQVAHDMIDALIDKRAERPVPPEFVKTLVGGVIEPVVIVNIGTDLNGRTWVCLNNGRQRTMGLRIVNAERVAKGLPEYTLTAVVRKFAPNATGAMMARQIKALANCRVQSTPMERAWLAQEFLDAGVPLSEIPMYVEVTTEQAVRNLLALLNCSPAVQAAVDLGVDAGGVTMTIAAKLSKLTHEEQDAKLATTAGKKGAAARAEVEETDAAPRMQKKAFLEKTLIEVRKIDPKGFKGQEERIADAKAILEFVMGNTTALGRCPAFIRLAVENVALASTKVKKGEFALATAAANDADKVDVDSIDADDIGLEEEEAA